VNAADVPVNRDLKRKPPDYNPEALTLELTCSVIILLLLFSFIKVKLDIDFNHYHLVTMLRAEWPGFE
jgi:hypothetical protein